MKTLSLAQFADHSKEFEHVPSFTIHAIEGDEVMRERLQEMGLLAGTGIQYLGRAPFGGPLLIRYDVCDLALREEEAKCLILSL
jgi:ferrous iron transport protein A